MDAHAVSGFSVVFPGRRSRCFTAEIRDLTFVKVIQYAVKQVFVR